MLDGDNRIIAPGVAYNSTVTWFLNPLVRQIRFPLLLSTGHCHQQGHLVFVMEHCSKRRIWIGANIIDEYAHEGRQPSRFVQ